MLPLLVNADYDETLAGNPPRPSHNALVECLALWVEDRPLRAHREYPPEFLAHVARRTGREPRLVHAGPGENWWGSLADPPLERRLNSKVWARRWWEARVTLPGAACFSEAEAFAALPPEGRGLIKRDHGVSGRGHWASSRAQWEETRSRLKNWWEGGVVVEPLLDRVSDLSALWTGENYVFYRNLVDHKFQWRGSVLEDGGSPTYTPAETAAMRGWDAHLAALSVDVLAQGYRGPFCVDAFFFRDGEGELRFHPCSEINARKTMGWVARALWENRRPAWAQLFLSPQAVDGDAWRSMAAREDLLVLSPPGHAFTWLWAEAEGQEALRATVAGPFPGRA